MAKQILNVGLTENDGTGDNLRDACVKVNANDTELYDRVGIGVFAALAAQTKTDITASDTYTPIAGIFTNVPAIGFEFLADPAIKYVGEETMYFKMDICLSGFAAANNTTVTGAIKKNGIILTHSLMQTFLKTTPDSYNFSGTDVFELAKGDKIQLVVKTNNGADVTFINITTTLKPFTI